MLKKTLIFTFTLLASYQNFWGITSNEVLNKINHYINNIKDSPTGAIDAVGNYTRGSGNGLNCSGFAKWIVDGFYYPLAKDEEEKYISLKKLRIKHPQERGTPDILKHEKTRDPYFGLDWTRNLAVELGKKRGESPSYKTYDVTDSTITKYVMNCGYPIQKIERVLKEQGQLKPNTIFLGSINGLFGRKPSLWQHHHVAVFIPYYDNGELKIAVLERNKETSFAYLLKRYPNTFCHLVAISTEGDFQLMIP